MKKDRMRSPASQVAVLGMLFALALSLSLLEGAIALPVPGVRLGLSNIAVMYCVFLCGPGQAYLLGTLKAFFVLMVRGMSGALLSLSGGLLSITVMLIAHRFSKWEGYTAISVAGAVSHNVGQVACAALLLREGAVLWYYLPVLAAVGVLVGTLTSMLLAAALPALEKLQGVHDRRGGFLR